MVTKRSKSYISRYLKELQRNGRETFSKILSTQDYKIPEKEHSPVQRFASLSTETGKQCHK